MNNTKQFKQLNQEIIQGICDIRAYAGDIVHGRYGDYDTSEYATLKSLAAALYSKEYYAWVDGGEPTEEILLAIVHIASLNDATSRARTAAEWAEPFLAEATVTQKL